MSTREQFVGWIADRFQARHATPLDRATAMSDAETCLTGFEEMEGTTFGNADFSWEEGDAHDFADEEIHAGWESVP